MTESPWSQAEFESVINEWIIADQAEYLQAVSEAHLHALWPRGPLKHTHTVSANAWFNVFDLNQVRGRTRGPGGPEGPGTPRYPASPWQTTAGLIRLGRGR